jgi:predicted DNA-binding protein with PD1-like motif
MRVFPYPGGHTDLQCIGGHLFSARVAVTAEIRVSVHGGALHRELDSESGLFLIAHS